MSDRFPLPDLNIILAALDRAIDAEDVATVQTLLQEAGTGYAPSSGAEASPAVDTTARKAAVA